ncbi:MAG: hypothetical protein ACRD8W_23075 [Nitrososphaeraceae archaeon]
MNPKNRTTWICLSHAAGVVGKHKTILSFATCAMITIVQKTAIFKNTQDLGRSISVRAAGTVKSSSDDSVMRIV